MLGIINQLKQIKDNYQVLQKEDPHTLSSVKENIGLGALGAISNLGLASIFAAIATVGVHSSALYAFIGINGGAGLLGLGLMLLGVHKFRKRIAEIAKTYL